MNDKMFFKSFETRIIVAVFVFFVFGFLLGWNFSDTTLSEAQLEFENVQLDLESFSQAIEFENNLGEFSCNNNLVESVGNNLYDNALRLDELEKQGLIESEYYNLLKKRHNVNQVLFYSYYKDYYDECDNFSNVILFFFNSSQDDLSLKQGKELDKLVENYDLIVLPMDYGYTDSLNYFYNFYGVNNLPYLVLDYNYTFDGATNSESIAKFLR